MLQHMTIFIFLTLICKFSSASSLGPALTLESVFSAFFSFFSFLARTYVVQLVFYLHTIAISSILYSRAQRLGGVTPLASGVRI